MLIVNIHYEEPAETNFQCFYSQNGHNFLFQA